MVYLSLRASVRAIYLRYTAVPCSVVMHQKAVHSDSIGWKGNRACADVIAGVLASVPLAAEELARVGKGGVRKGRRKGRVWP